MFYIYVDAFKVTMIKNKYFKLIKRYLTFDWLVDLSSSYDIQQKLLNFLNLCRKKKYKCLHFLDLKRSDNMKTLIVKKLQQLINKTMIVIYIRMLVSKYDINTFFGNLAKYSNHYDRLSL